MKLRNSLLAVATATALVSGGVAAPAHAAEQPFALTALSSSNEDAAAETTDPNADAGESGSSNADLTKAKNWIGVVAAIIGLLGTVIAFATKNFGLTLPKLG